MKQVIVLLALLTSLEVHLLAQSSSFNNETGFVLEKVIRDYPSRFQHMKGAGLSASTFQSTLSLPKSVQCIIVENSSTIAWQAILAKSNQFIEGSNSYKQWYEQIKNTIVKLENEKPIILHGQYEAPSNKRSCNTLLFDLLPCGRSLQKLKVELCLQQQDNEWAILLNVYEGDKKAIATDLVAN